MDLLAHYTERAKDMGDVALHFALIDIRATLHIWKDEEPSHPYVAKLLAEFDAYTSAVNDRRKPRAKRRAH